uniref:Fibrinogen alpha chain n=1 Tax=Pelodiscus sinensis TaxID=13735 RepID=K7FND3_PELSI|nr:fibrinogen alpha chain [Pelodiscus sinensis]|eukprot:XP_006111615.1 fibrinogen alpha chain [Pelodiscus sinensis]
MKQKKQVERILSVRLLLTLPLKMIPLRILCMWLCLSIAWATNDESTFLKEGGGVRGPRVMEHASQSECKQDKGWPFCADDDWGHKCPSGCRMQGLIDETDKDFHHRIQRIRNLLLDNENKYKKSNVLTVETINFLKGNLASALESDNKYGQISEDLRRRLVLLKQKVLVQVNRIKVLQNSIRDQVVEMKRLEVDIDIKIRACKGSCAKSLNYQVDTESYENIQKQLTQASSIDLQSVLETSSLKVLKMRPLKDSIVPAHFKTLPQTQELNILDEIVQVVMTLERPEGEEKVETSRVSVVSGVGGGAQDGKTVTSSHGKETVGLGGKHTSIIRHTCTRTITKKIITGPGGPREEIVETMTSPDGSDCSHFQGSGREEVTGRGDITHVRVTSQGGTSDLSKLIPEYEKFFTESGSSSSKFHTTYTSDSGTDHGTRTGSFGSGTGRYSSGGTASHTTHSGGTESFADLGEGEEDIFDPHFDPSRLPSSKVQSGSSAHVETRVTSSSSSSTSFNKGGSTFETKSLKSRAVTEELGGLQHEESGEDTPDFRARSLRTAGEKLGTSYTGTDCDDIRQKHTSGAKSGIFRIKPAGSDKVFSVYCDQETTLGGWLLIQQRLDGSVNFNRTWQDYKKGFGSMDGKGKGEFWLGNENIHLLTQKDTVLRVELEDWDGNEAYAEYNIHVGSESDGYVLSVSAYEGTAGDALIIGSVEEGIEYTAHANMKFSTFDRDSDQWEENCAEVYGGGWWYNNCQAANLNGIYYQGGQYDPRNNVPYEIENGVVWIPFRASDYSLKVVRMKIRPIETQ